MTRWKLTYVPAALLAAFFVCVLAGCVEFKGDLSLIPNDDAAARWLTEHQGVWAMRPVVPDDEKDAPQDKYLARVVSEKGNRGAMHYFKFESDGGGSGLEGGQFNLHVISATDGYLMFASPEEKDDPDPTVIIWYIKTDEEQLKAYLFAPEAKTKDGNAKSIEIVTAEDIHKLQEDPGSYFDHSKAFECRMVDTARLFDDSK
ncbi:MAG: hypothetical protein CMJ46_00010 [Planctomyces sp.]|nr:hypothetical protein [Planctomyces sp.]